MEPGNRGRKSGEKEAEVEFGESNGSGKKLDKLCKSTRCQTVRGKDVNFVNYKAELAFDNTLATVSGQKKYRVSLTNTFSVLPMQKKIYDSIQGVDFDFDFTLYRLGFGARIFDLGFETQSVSPNQRLCSASAKRTELKDRHTWSSGLSQSH